MHSMHAHAHADAHDAAGPWVIGPADSSSRHPCKGRAAGALTAAEPAAEPRAALRLSIMRACPMRWAPLASQQDEMQGTAAGFGSLGACRVPCTLSWPRAAPAAGLQRQVPPRRVRAGLDYVLPQPGLAGAVLGHEEVRQGAGSCRSGGRPRRNAQVCPGPSPALCLLLEVPLAWPMPGGLAGHGQNARRELSRTGVRVGAGTGAGGQRRGASVLSTLYPSALPVDTRLGAGKDPHPPIHPLSEAQSSVPLCGTSVWRLCGAPTTATPRCVPRSLPAQEGCRGGVPTGSSGETAARYCTGARQ